MPYERTTPTLRMQRIAQVQIPNYEGMTYPGSWAKFLKSGHGFANFAPFMLASVKGFEPIGDLAKGDHWLFKWKRKTWRLRTLRESGLYFSASKSRGAGRAAAPSHYRELYGSVDGFLVADIKLWKDGIHVMTIYKVPIEDVWKAYLNGPMNKITGKVTRSGLVWTDDPE